MKFVLALIAAVAAQTVCTDDDVADTCTEEGSCCGYLSPAEGDATRACSDADKAGAFDYEGTDAFSCEAPVAAEEGAAKVALGATVIMAALYMA